MNEARDLSHFVEHLDGGIARLHLAIDGITCAGCMFRIENGLAGVPNVEKARVNLTNRRLAVEWRDGTLDPVHLIDRLADLGYKAQPFDPEGIEIAETHDARFLLRCLGVAAFAAMNIMLLSVSVWSGNLSDITSEQRDFFHWLSALIALPAAAYAGRPFFHSGVRALASGRLNMDVPITLGVLLALAMSVFETLHHAEHAYFDSAIMLLTFLLAGRYLDQNMRRRTRAVAANLAALKAEMACKVVSADETSEVPIAAIRAGDIVLVRPGERLAVDGVVVDGSSSVDQSLVTGETRPLGVGKGANVYAGTLNISGMLRVRADAAASGTLLDEVSRLLEKAIEARSRYVRLADRAARFYAPAVHLTALATLLGWIAAGASWHDAIVIAIAVLIITCPCALGLAIPAVQVVASGALFRAGVLLRAGEAIERLADVDTIVFDKTGTLTLPDSEVVNAAEVPDHVLVLASRLALASRHPLARAVARAAHAKAPIDGAIEEAGQGVRACVNGIDIRLGRPSFCDAEAQAAAVAQQDPEASTIAVAYGDERHVFCVRQRIRPDAASTINELRNQGFSIEILSGDRHQAVEHVARALVVNNIRAGVAPADKIRRIEELKRAGCRVLMVGDGLNDAPALAGANVSISPVSAAQVTQAAADAIFLGDALAPVATALAIARRAKHIMRQNLAMAVLYNAIAVPVAIFGFATPLVAAIAMSGSSILVTANALRARKLARKATRWRS